MKLIEPKVEIVPQGEGLSGVYKQIELAGRTCYKSENKITDGSAKDFTLKMISNGHTAMLEHGTVYLAIPPVLDYNKYVMSKYSLVNKQPKMAYVTTNLRVLGENNWLDDLHYLCEPTEFHEKRVTARFTCDRGVSHELVRHRVFSFAQESTRYCNYSKDKFGNELTFIIPSWAQNLREGSFDDTFGLDFAWSSTDGGESLRCNDKEACFMGVLNKVESRYMESIQRCGLTAQQARQMLPNALKTEVVMTGFVSDWQHFFDLRCAPNAHPDMQVLAKDLYRQFIETGLIK